MRTTAPTRTWRSSALIAAIMIALLTGCAPEAPIGDPTGADFALSSPDLDAEGRLPAWATNTAGSFCSGENRSPELRWSGAPQGTAGYALTMTDPANPSYVHWVLTGLPGDATGVPSAPGGATGIGVTGTSWRGAGYYAGVCLPDNPYRYTVYALDTEITGRTTTTLDALLEQLEGHVLATATLDVLRADAP